MGPSSVVPHQLLPLNLLLEIEDKGLISTEFWVLAGRCTRRIFSPVGGDAAVSQQFRPNRLEVPVYDGWSLNALAGGTGSEWRATAKEVHAFGAGDRGIEEKTANLSRRNVREVIGVGKKGQVCHHQKTLKTSEKTKLPLQGYF